MGERNNRLKTTAYIGIGSNLGDREENLSQALELLGRLEGTELITYSAIFESEPMYLTEQPDYLNMVAEISTSLSSVNLLKELLSFENGMGRVREIKFGSRLMDFDILFFGEEIVSSETLTLPHPLLYDRLFVLLPLSEIAGDFICPVKHKSIRELLKLSKDESRISKYEIRTPAGIN